MTKNGKSSLIIRAKSDRANPEYIRFDYVR